MATGQGVTYAEVRRWAIWLDVFTPQDLADAMSADLSAGQRGVRALLWHGICKVAEEIPDAPEGLDVIIQYIPIPPGPKEHPHEPPVWRATEGVYSEAPRRGMPVPSRRKSDGTIRNRRPGRVGPVA